MVETLDYCTVTFNLAKETPAITRQVWLPNDDDHDVPCVLRLDVVHRVIQ